VWRSASVKRGALTLLLVSTIMLPAMVASQILWHTLTKQIYASYEKRLATGLQTFELILDGSYRTLQDAVSRIAADNTMRVTMELEILPQLRRYLHSQNEVSSIHFLTVSRTDGKPFFSDNGTEFKTDMRVHQCNYSPSGPVDTLTLFDTSLILSRSLPVVHKGQVLGFVCGGVLLNDRVFLDQLKDTLGALPSMWHQGQSVPSSLIGDLRVNAVHPQGKMFDYSARAGHFKGMLDHIKIGNQQLTIGILIPLEALKEGFEQAIISILLAFFLIALIVLLALRHLSLQRKAQQRLVLEQERAMVTLSSIGDAVLTTDINGRITYLNSAAETLTGYTFNKLQGRTWDERFQIKNEETGIPVPNPIMESLKSGEKIVAPSSSVLVRPDGSETAVNYSAAPIGDNAGLSNGVVLVLRDVAQERHLQRTLSWKASRDDLTGLFNRPEFRYRLHQAIENARERKLEHGLLYLDLDQFKVVNDSCGHRVGDQLLKNLSALLKAHLRATDTLARLGGDEFGILLEGCPPEKAMLIAESIRDLVSEYRFSHGDKVFDIGASIGVAMINERSNDVEDLMSLVDAACYTAKELGRNRIHFAELTRETSDRRLLEMQWATRIKDALKSGRFRLFYQPIVPITGTVTESPPDHGEILVRMVDDEGNLIPPGSFIPAAERYGLMPDIDRWIVHELFRREQSRYQALWNRLTRESAKPTCLYTINLSGASLIETSFLEFVKQQMREYKIPPQLVCFEITETIAITHLDRATRFMRDLKAMGCRFLLDDFGSGMSSFGYLKKLPVDYLKIDGLFVKDILEDPIDYAMVKAINEIGHTMGLKTVAEFVENEAILQELHIMGVDYAQGYGISPPRPLQEVLQTQPTLPTTVEGEFTHHYSPHTTH
jgi:diguanylate cyclase (GGDEF)-like protein/PAS domain S-box-containing protein